VNTSAIVQKFWNCCYGPGCGQNRTRSPARKYAGTRVKPRLTLRDDGMSCGDYVEQLTYLVSLKLADERTMAPYNQKSPVPEKYDWPSLIKKDGAERFH
jgi:hypothetical protein